MTSYQVFVKRKFELGKTDLKTLLWRQGLGVQLNEEEKEKIGMRTKDFNARFNRMLYQVTRSKITTNAV